MFDMGFTELMLIGVVALVVIGPEKLPGVARTAGKYFARLRSFMTNVRADVESELKADELREMFEEQQKELQSLKEVVGEAEKEIGLSEISSEVSEIASSIEDANPVVTPPPAVEKKKPARVEAKSKSTAKRKSAAKLKPKASARAKTQTAAKDKPVVKTRAPKAKAKAKTVKSAKVKAN